jgi:hypothetical protein
MVVLQEELLKLHGQQILLPLHQHLFARLGVSHDELFEPGQIVPRLVRVADDLPWSHLPDELRWRGDVVDLGEKRGLAQFLPL